MAEWQVINVEGYGEFWIFYNNSQAYFIKLANC